MWPRRRFSQKSTIEDSIWNQRMRQRQQSIGNGGWNLDARPTRVSFSCPAIRKRNHSKIRVYDYVKKDCGKIESPESSFSNKENFIPDRISFAERCHFDRSPPTFDHKSNLNRLLGFSEQQSPLQEIVLNSKQPVLKKFFKDKLQSSTGVFDCGEISVKEQQLLNLFHHPIGSCCQNPMTDCIGDSSRTSSNSSGYYGISPKSITTNLKTFRNPERIILNSRKSFRQSSKYCNFSISPEKEQQSWSDIDWHPREQVGEEATFIYPETPTSKRERIYSPEKLCGRTTLNKETSTNNFTKNSDRNTPNSKEFFRGSPKYFNFSIPPEKEQQSLNDIDWYPKEQVEEERTSIYPETPESRRERISSPESLFGRTTLNETPDIWDYRFDKPSIQQQSSPSFPSFSDAFPFLPPESSLFPKKVEKRSSICQLQPCSTDPDEEYAKMKTSLPVHHNFSYKFSSLIKKLA